MAKFRDVVINIYSCPPSGTGGIYPPDICGFSTRWLYDQIWQPLQVRPLNLQVMGTGKLGNDFSEDMSAISRGGLKKWILSRVSKSKDWPDGADVGRIALVGFSAGCGAVNKLLASSDTSYIDTVILLDGMHGMYKYPDYNKKEPNGTSPDDVEPASIANYVDFAVKAAKGEKTMVVTHSKEIVNAINRTVASTAKTAQAVKNAVISQVGDSVQPQIVPEALLGMNGKSPKVPLKPDGSPIWADYPICWPNKWNAPPPGVDVRAPFCSWPIGDNSVIGNLVILGTSVPGTNNQPSHMFHSYWMYKAVLEEILVPRWTFECEKGAFSSAPSMSMPGFVKPTSASTFLKRNPKLVRTFGTPQLGGIGEAFCDVFSCEGVFSGITWDEIRMARVMWQASWLAASAAAAGGLYYWLKRR